MEKNENPWKIIEQRSIYENQWINLTEYDVINPNGGQGIYGKVHMQKLALGVLVLDTEENIYLVGQYRFAIDQYSWEIPEGGGEVGEEPIVGAKRELLEEAGIIAEDWSELLVMHTSNSVTDEKAIVFVAKDLTFTQNAPDETEDLKQLKMPFKQALQMVLDGEITDSMSVAGILTYALLKTL